MFTNTKLAKSIQLAIAFGAVSGLSLSTAALAQETEEAEAQTEFDVILKAAGATTKHLKALIWASVAMLVTGYVGEAGLGHAAIWGGLSGAAYFYIVYLIKFGDLAKLAEKAGGAVESAHKTLVLFVLIGWAIYPVGYMVGTGEGMWYEFFTGLVSAENIDLIYNVGDSINKIGFGLVVYNLAVSK